MKKTIKTCCLIVTLGLFSCTNNSPDDLTSPELQIREVKIPQTKLNSYQAMLYANMLANVNDGETTNSDTRSMPNDRIVSDIQYYVQDEDTVIYVFNYGQDQGFLMLGADNSSNPILAQSKEGRLDLDKIDCDSYLKVFIKSNAQRIKEEIYNSENINSDYFEDWADLGKDGYEYIIETADDEPSAKSTRGSSRRKSSSGKSTIYPYTGKDLEYWCQEGGYNMSAPNQACIGCPAIAVSMLLYDLSYRITGTSSLTLPSFYYTDREDIKYHASENSLSIRLKEVADHIPNYQWGEYKGAGSGASPLDIQIGLRNLGFINATLTDYDFETLYNQMYFQGVNYFGDTQNYSRGILLGAFHMNPNAGGGHIWFCDGYYEQSFTVTKKFLGIKVKSWTEYDDRLYMNWGWGKNNGNGWYAAKESVWTTLEGNKQSIDFKKEPKMFINLSNYVYPY